MLQSQALRALAKRLPPNVRRRMRTSMARGADITAASKLWSWEVSRTTDGEFDVLYAGRAEERWRALALFPGHEQARTLGASAISATGRPTLLLTEFSLNREAFKVPCELSSLVQLKRPISELIAEFDSELRRRLRRLTEQAYRLEAAAPEQVEALHRDMFVPFALARHADHAHSHSLEGLLRLASVGRIDVLYKGDELVGSQVGYPYERDGTRRWAIDRFGYPERVFEDPKTLADVNTMNIHLACQRALEAGYDYYDLGVSSARPNGGLLQFKRRRSSSLERSEQALSFYAHVPAAHRPQILSRAPLFAVDRDRLVLHVGVTRAMSDDALLQRFQEWGYGGLAGVRLWTERSLDASLLERIHDHYSKRGFETAVTAYQCAPPTQASY
jgi:hypothetical protein